VAFYQLQNEIHDAFYGEMERVAREKGCWDDIFKMYLSELKSFSHLRKRGILNATSELSGEYHFDFRTIVEKEYDINPREYFLEKPLRITFRYSESQRKEMESYLQQYGTNTMALGRALLRAHIKRLSAKAS
jgi:hypothetical protein